MTLTEITARLALGVNRDDLASSYTQMTNEALGEITRRRSWLGMKKRATVTVLSGTSSIALPSDFKELTRPKSPISYTNPEGVLIPVDVVTREQRIRRATQIPATTFRVFIDRTTTPPALNIYDLASEDIAFDVSYYGYPADLVDGSDSNFLTTNWPEMVIAKTKAIAFAAVNDPIAEDMEEMFEKKFSEASRQDGYAALADAETRM